MRIKMCCSFHSLIPLIFISLLDYLLVLFHYITQYLFISHTLSAVNTLPLHKYNEGYN